MVKHSKYLIPYVYSDNYKYECIINYTNIFIILSYVVNIHKLCKIRESYNKIIHLKLTEISLLKATKEKKNVC